MMVRQRAKQLGVELPLVISDHCDWPELTETISELKPGAQQTRFDGRNAEAEGFDDLGFDQIAAPGRDLKDL